VLVQQASSSSRVRECPEASVMVASSCPCPCGKMNLLHTKLTVRANGILRLGTVIAVCKGLHCVRFEDGGSEWIRLRAGMYEPLSTPIGRLCGTPGCTLPDWHIGCHSTERRLPPRLPQQSISPPPHCSPRRSPRLAPRRFRWHELDVDIQAVVLLQLSPEREGLLSHLSHLARHIRPFRDAILHAIRLHNGLRDMLSAGWATSSTKFDCDMSDLSCSWLCAHRLDAFYEELDERVELGLRLQWDASPSRWRWLIALKWYVNARPHGSMCVGACEGTVPARGQIGVRRPALRSQQALRVTVTRECTASPQQMQRQRACVCNFPLANLDRMRIGTTNGGSIRLTFCRRTLLLWAPTRESKLAMRLVGALVSP